MTVGRIEVEKLMWALIKLYKSQGNVAKALGQKKSTFKYWLNVAKEIPYDHIIEMQELLEKTLQEKAHKKNGTAIKLPFKRLKSISKETFSKADQLLSIADRVRLAMRYEEKIGNRRGQRSDLAIEFKESSLFDVYDDSSNDEMHKKLTELDKNFYQVDKKSCDKKKIIKGRIHEIVFKLAGFNNFTTYIQAKKVVKKGIPALIEAMDSGKYSIYLASQVANLPEQEQASLVVQDAKSISAYIKSKVSNNKDCSTTRAVNISVYQLHGLIEAEKSSHLPLRSGFAWLLSHCDTAGEFQWQTNEYKDQPFLYTAINFSELMEALVRVGLVTKVKHDGKEFGRIQSIGEFIFEVHFPKKNIH